MQPGGRLKQNLAVLSCLKDNFRNFDRFLYYSAKRYDLKCRPSYRPVSNLASRPRKRLLLSARKNSFDDYSCGCNLEHSRRMSFSLSSFPWCQGKIDSSKDDPLHHKVIGMFMLKKVLRNYTREDFDMDEFIQGVKGAIKLLADCVCTHDKGNHLPGILGPDVHARFLQAFTSMKMEKKRVVLEVEALHKMKMSGIRLVCGSADEGDEYEICFLGQKIITSKRDMFELEKRVDSTGYSSLFKFGKQLGMSAAEKQLRFQIDVKFTANEKFYVEQKTDNTWDVVCGETDVVTSQHNLRFESLLQDKEETIDGYPLSWKIVNIDFVDDIDINND